MSGHFQSAHYRGGHHRSSHFGGEYVAPPEVIEQTISGGADIFIEKERRYRKKDRDIGYLDDDIITASALLAIYLEEE